MTGVMQAALCDLQLQINTAEFALRLHKPNEFATGGIWQRQRFQTNVVKTICAYDYKLDLLTLPIVS